MMDERYITTFTELHKVVGRVCEFSFAYRTESDQDGSGWMTSDEAVQIGLIEPEQNVRLHGRLGIKFTGISNDPVFLFYCPEILSGGVYQDYQIIYQESALVAMRLKEVMHRA